MPANAQLLVEGQPVQLDPETRSFQTPALKPGNEYVYTIQTESLRDGRKVMDSREVRVRAGETAQVAFRSAEVVPVAAREKAELVASKITVRLPESAKLYINDTACPLTTGERAFYTPKLAVGKSYTYTLKAEVVRDGRSLTETREVVFRAGQPITVDFGAMNEARVARR
jgi:uncharacterized protein (TIGR03000 family)